MIDLYRTYSQVCTSILCNPAYGLTCSTGTGAACPTAYGSGYCDCSSTQYWTGSACASKSSYGGTCTTRGNCQCVTGKLTEVLLNFYLYKSRCHRNNK